MCKNQKNLCNEVELVLCDYWNNQLTLDLLICKNVGLWPWMHVYEVFTIFWAFQILFDVHSKNEVVITTILK